MPLTTSVDSPSTGAVEATPEVTARVPREFTVRSIHLWAFFGSYAVVVAAFVGLATLALGVR